MKRKMELAQVARWSGLVGVTLLALAGCGSKENHDAPGGGKGTAQSVLDPTTTAGAVVFGVNGEIRVVDGNGRPIAPCSLPGAGKDTDGAPECPKVRGTTILSAEAISVVRHTGSHCMLLGMISAGKYITFPVPPGCTN